MTERCKVGFESQSPIISRCGVIRSIDLMRPSALPAHSRVTRPANAGIQTIVERVSRMSGGMRTASCGFFNYAKCRFDYLRDRIYRWPPLLSIPTSLFYSFASILATPWIEYRLKNSSASALHPRRNTSCHPALEVPRSSPRGRPRKDSLCSPPHPNRYL